MNFVEEKDVFLVCFYALVAADWMSSFMFKAFLQ